MDPIIIASLITGLVSLITGGVGMAVNATQQNQTNLKNEELLRESWQRDDSQMQRAKADAQAAGFSPLAALGNMPGNTNPTQMQPVQIDTNGIQNALGGTVDRIAQRKAQMTQDKLTQAQVEQAEAEAEGKKLDNLIRLAKAYDEIWGSKLEIGDKIGAMLEAEVINEDDVPEMYKIFKATKTPGKERGLTERGIKAQEASNANTAWSIANQAEQFRETMDSTKEHNERTEEYTFNYGVGSVKLGIKRSSEGMYLPISAGINPAEKPSLTMNWAKPLPDNLNKNDLKFVGYTTDGLPVVQGKTVGNPMIVVPSGKGNSKLYETYRGQYIEAPYSEWARKYESDYNSLLFKMKNEKVF